MRRLAAAFAFASLVIASSGAIAQQQNSQGTPDERAACAPDVRKFCHQLKEGVNGNNDYLMCLQSHREKLSKGCRGVLESHGV